MEARNKRVRSLLYMAVFPNCSYLRAKVDRWCSLSSHIVARGRLSRLNTQNLLD